jgi:alpha-tubulin suppressor-like RCC1 family protein
VLDNNALKCWGDNQGGRLGIGDTLHRGDNASEMSDSLPTVALGTGRTAKTVSASVANTCVILDNDAVKCWGGNLVGELGLGDTLRRGDLASGMGDSLPTVNLGAGRSVKAINSGKDHHCALLDNDTVKCWGNASFGRLGLGDTLNRGDAGGEMGDCLPAISFGTGLSVRSLSASSPIAETHCVVLSTREVKCWASGKFGNLGGGNTFDLGDAAGEMGDSLAPIQLGDN